MGEVYRAADTKLNRQVAIKIIVADRVKQILTIRSERQRHRGVGRERGGES